MGVERAPRCGVQSRLSAVCTVGVNKAKGTCDAKVMMRVNFFMSRKALGNRKEKSAQGWEGPGIGPYCKCWERSQPRPREGLGIGPYCKSWRRSPPSASPCVTHLLDASPTLKHEMP